ncbi:MAG: C4-type zinc ribbon domain-containing protein [Myxococcota bacterium]
MIDQLKALVRLQKIDLEIKKLVEERVKVIEPFEKLKQGYEASERKVLELSSAAIELKEKIRKTEAILNIEKDKVLKWDQRLKSLKSARDYAAMQREIEIQKRMNVEMEEGLIKDMEEDERLNRELEGERKNKEELEAKLVEERKKLDEVLSRIDSTIAEHQKLRREELPMIENGLSKRYEMIRERRQGIAIAEVIDDRCQGCFMNIPPQLSNIVQTGKSIESCPACNRFLYYRPLVEEGVKDKEGGKEEAKEENGGESA